MELSDYLRDPMYAALIGGIITSIYSNLRAKLNKEPRLELSEYIKPSALVALLVYFIVSGGIGGKEKISADPF